jgi:hypothetical protein
MLAWLRSLFIRRPVRLAIVRRYCDANGSYVGELYLEQEQHGISSYRMIGASLDTLHLDCVLLKVPVVDTRNDFLVPMPPGVVRVGALEPADNDRVRRMVASLPRRNMTLTIKNGFIEHVMEAKKA